MKTSTILIRNVRLLCASSGLDVVTDALLRELGYGAEAIAALRAQQAI